MHEAPETAESNQPSDPITFTIEAPEAAERLGVSRTRLSQITSRGDLSFIRRRVGARIRIFYNDEELGAYVRARGETAHFRSTGSQALLARLNQMTPASPARAERQGADTVTAPWAHHGRGSCSEPAMAITGTRVSLEPEEVQHTPFSADRLSRMERTLNALAASLARDARPKTPLATEQAAQRLAEEQFRTFNQHLQTLERRLAELEFLLEKGRHEASAQTRQILLRSTADLRTCLATTSRNRFTEQAKEPRLEDTLEESSTECLRKRLRPLWRAAASANGTR
jgi:DnaJ-domain-containing protein 1